MQNTSDTVKKQVGSYPRFAAENSGKVQDVEKWEKGQDASQRLLEQSIRIADKMEAVGFKAYDDTQDLTLFGLNSEGVKKLDTFRNISFIPSVARKKRRKAQLELEYFLQKNTRCRMWTMTTGRRCNFQELPQRIEWIHGKFGRVNSTRFMKKFGAKFVFRATEFGEIARTDDGLSFHPHVHALLYLDKKLSANEWSCLLLKIKDYFVYYSQDCGVIRDAKELVKYCVKPCDLEHLNGHELVALHKVCTKKRLVEFLGGLRQQRKYHKEQNYRLVRRHGKLGKTRNWVGGAKKLPRWLHNNDDSVARPTVVAWCAPSTAFTHITEPCFIVHGLGNADPSQVFKWFDVKQMRRSIIVHTKTLTHNTEKRENEKIDESKKKIFEKSSRFKGISRVGRKPDKVVS